MYPDESTCSRSDDAVLTIHPVRIDDQAKSQKDTAYTVHEVEEQREE